MAAKTDVSELANQLKTTVRGLTSSLNSLTRAFDGVGNSLKNFQKLQKNQDRYGDALLRNETKLKKSNDFAKDKFKIFNRELDKAQKRLTTVNNVFVKNVQVIGGVNKSLNAFSTKLSTAASILHENFTKLSGSVEELFKTTEKSRAKEDPTKPPEKADFLGYLQQVLKKETTDLNKYFDAFDKQWDGFVKKLGQKEKEDEGKPSKADVMPALAPVFDTINDIFQQKLPNTFRSVMISTDALKRAFNVIPEVMKEYSTAGTQAAKETAQLKFQFVGLAGAIGALAVITHLFQGAFKDLFNTVTKYAGVFNPALLEIFNRAVEDLHGTIGEGLQPALEAMINVVRTFADNLVPIIQKLSPAFTSLANMIGNALMPIITAVISAFEKLEAFINLTSDLFGVFVEAMGEVVAEMIDGLVPVIQVLIMIFGALSGMIGWVIKLLAPLIEIVIPGLIVAFTTVSIALLLEFLPAVMTVITSLLAMLGPVGWVALALGALASAGYALLKWFGVVEERKSALAQTGASQGKAQRNSAYMQVEELSKNLIQGAFSQGSIAKQQLEVEKKQLAELQKIANKKEPGRALAAPAPAPGAA